MKKTMMMMAMMVVTMVAMAQGQELNVQSKGIAPVEKGVVSGLNNMGAFLKMDIERGRLDMATLQQRYGLLERDGAWSVAALVQMAAGHDEAELKGYGVMTKRHYGHAVSVQIPMERYVEFVESRVCRSIELGVMASKKMNDAREATGLNALYGGVGYAQRYDGSGVVVGVIDHGFEYAHPTFYDSTHTTLRVKRAWNQRASSGTSPADYGYGAEYATTAAIVAAATDDSDETHGTHVASIAAGCGGSNAVGKKYRGVAPAADIVMVSYSGSTVTMLEGLEYVMDYAEGVNKPCVINLSLGSHVGPHDGTSAFDRYCDTLLAGRTGVVLVGAAGNEGRDSLHLSKTFSASDTSLLTLMDFSGSAAGYSMVDIWGDPGVNYSVGVALLDMSDYTVADATYSYLSTASNYATTSVAGVVDVSVWQEGTNEYNNRQNITLQIDAEALASYGNAYRVMLFVYGNNGTVHMWCSEYTKFCNEGLNVEEGNTDYTVGEIGGTGNSMLTVGSYVTRNQWENSFTGQTYTTYSTVGALSGFSSHGPTLDGRVKPDVIAPGEYIAAGVNRFNTSYYGSSSPYGVESTTVGGNTEYYAVMQGTSMATPFVTGVVALWLQDNPTLTYADVLDIVHSTALADGFTGSIPTTGSNLYGWGKINVAGEINSTVTTYTLTVVSDDATMGTAVGGGSYAAGQTVSIGAEANEGYIFAHWQDGNTDNPRSVTVSGNATYTAYFEAYDPCVITTFPYEEGFEDANALGCIIIIDQDGDGSNWQHMTNSSQAVGHASQAAVGSASYDNGTHLALTPDNWLILPAMALPAGASMHLSWYDKGFDPDYAVEHYSVMLTTGGRDVVSNYTTTLYSGTSTAEWVQHDVDLTAYAGQTVGIAFRHHNSSDQYFLLIDDVRVGTATAPSPTPTRYTLTVVSDDPTMGTVSGGGVYEAGQTASISATANQGYRFVRWNDANTSATRTVTVTGNATYTAYFEAVQGVEEAEGETLTVGIERRVLTVKGLDNEWMSIEDMLGRTIYHCTDAQSVTVELPQRGVYFVKTKGRAAVKVVAM